MAGKWDGRTCPVCGEGTLHDGSRVTNTEYRSESFVADQPGAYCDKCDEGVVYHDQLLENGWEEFRNRVDTEQALELAAIRARLGLTQEQAAKISGGGHNAFSRYERGEAQPVIGVLNLFRLLDKYPSLVVDLLPTAAAPVFTQPVFNLGVAVEPPDIFWGIRPGLFAAAGMVQAKALVLALTHQQFAVFNSGSVHVIRNFQPNDWSSPPWSGAHTQSVDSLTGSGNRGPFDA